MSDRVDLGPAKLLRLHGADARSFAQAQFCNDVTALAVGDWQWNAWLDAKGRVRFFFALVDRDDGGLWAWLPLGDSASFASELSRFLFRAKLKIAVVEGWGLQGRYAKAADASRISPTDSGFVLQLDGIQQRQIVIGPDIDQQLDELKLHAWRGCDIADGLPLIDDGCAGEFVPQALDLERANAISFRKGCYPGQEIVARLHFRGGNKRCLRRLRWEATDGVARSGSTLRLSDGGESVGQLLYSGCDTSSTIGLAVLSDVVESGTSLLLDNSIAVRVIDA